LAFNIVLGSVRLAADWRLRSACDTIWPVSIIKINAITVPPGAGDELAKRFAARAGAVDDQDGFEGFELLQPTDGRDTWLVVTRWRDEEAFQAWVASPAFAHGHQGADAPAPHGGPVSTHSELWSYQVALSSGPPAS
jgi:heme-degrading monooxygenase HmoA